MDLLGLAEAKQTWFYGLALGIAAALLFLNLLVMAGVHVRRVREWLRGQRARAFRRRVDEMLDRLAADRDSGWLQAELSGFDELERPVAAVALIERLEPATSEERARTLDAVREAGALDVILKATTRRVPWRRALAIRTLGWLGATEAVPLLLDRLSDPNRHVREAAARALGRIGDERAVAPLADLHRTPGKIGAGVVYDALVALRAEPVFAGALGSEHETVRVSSCFGIVALAEPGTVRSRVTPLLADASPAVRAAAAEALGLVGGETLPESLARATRDEEPAVRAAATGALGAFDDGEAVETARSALLDADRETALSAAESLVRLSRLPAAGAAARAALERAGTDWTVEQSLTLASVGAL